MTDYRNDRAAREEIAASLSRLLADSYTLYLKTQGFHWNVTGPRFYDLHKLFEEQYGALAEANDEIAERIRALGVAAPASYSAFARLAGIQEQPRVPDGRGDDKRARPGQSQPGTRGRAGRHGGRGACGCRQRRSRDATHPGA